MTDAITSAELNRTVDAIKENHLIQRDFISYIGSTPTKFRDHKLNETDLSKEFNQFLDYKIKQLKVL